MRACVVRVCVVHACVRDVCVRGLLSIDLLEAVAASFNFINFLNSSRPRQQSRRTSKKGYKRENMSNEAWGRAKRSRSTRISGKLGTVSVVN